MHLDEMCVMELDFNLQVTHFPTGKKHQLGGVPHLLHTRLLHWEQVLRCILSYLERQDEVLLSASLSCCSSLRSGLGSSGRDPSGCRAARTKQKWGSQSFCVCRQMLEQRCPGPVLRGHSPAHPGFWGSPGYYLVGSVLDLGLVSFGSISCVTQQNTWPLCLFTVTSFLWRFSNISFWFHSKHQ